jgi:hypothetical protein
MDSTSKQPRATSEEGPRLKVCPEQSMIDEAFAGVLNNIQLRECMQNKGYIHALLPSFFA